MIRNTCWPRTVYTAHTRCVPCYAPRAQACTVNYYIYIYIALFRLWQKHEKKRREHTARKEPVCPAGVRITFEIRDAPGVPSEEYHLTTCYTLYYAKAEKLQMKSNVGLHGTRS